MRRVIETLDGWIDLAAAAIGGRALVANDEFFAGKENLLLPGPAVFDPERYTDRGKWMDGWETRRRRTPGHDWCIVRLGVPGEVRAIVVDTRHFRGNHPQAAWVDALDVEEPIGVAALADHPGWRRLAPRTELAGDSVNRLEIEGDGQATYVRLAIDPDGGVARLRVFGSVRPVGSQLLAGGEPIDLAAIANGGRIVGCSDEFFSSPIHILMPGDGSSMADGWETRRRRGPGHDWVGVRLGLRGRLTHAVVDTRYFKGNFPAACALSGCDAGRPSENETCAWHLTEHPTDDPEGTCTWHPLLMRTPLTADAEHVFTIDDGPAVTHVRLDVFPDGGISRLRLFGRPADEVAG